MKYIPFHIHSVFSILDSALEFEEYIEWGKKQGLTALSLTDHGSLAGSFGFYQQCRAADINPILGCEFYLDDDPKGRNHYHIILIAKNINGYNNLVKLNNRAVRENSYYKPRLKNEWLLNTRVEDVMISTACIYSQFSQLIVTNKHEEALQLIQKYHCVYGDDFYLEIQFNEMSDQHALNEFYQQVSKDYGIKLVVGIDAHYKAKEDVYIQDSLFKVKQLSSGKGDIDKAMKFDARELYLKTMQDIFSDARKWKYKIDMGQIVNAVKSSEEIASKCDVKFDTALKYPDIDTSGVSLDTLFLNLCQDGLKQKYKKKLLDSRNHKLYCDNIKKEFDALKQANFLSMFVIAHDLRVKAKEERVILGPGRGSVAGSFCSYLLDITWLNPLEYGLLFERFCDPNRVTNPDIDMDFSDREKVVDIVKKTYGVDRVFKVANFLSYEVKSALRDSLRIEGVIPSEVNAMMKNWDDEKTVSENLDTQEMRDFANLHQSAFKLFKKLVGKIRGIGTHASAVVIVPEGYEIPIAQRNGEYYTQFDGSLLDAQGFLKLDILGLETLSIIAKTLELGKIDIDLQNMDLNDAKVYEEYHQGNTIGVFQVEKENTVQIFKQIEVKSFEDITNVISVIRPGLDKVKFIENSLHPERIKHIPGTDHILGSTKGVLLYQEQVMKLCADIGGFPLGETDEVRRIIAKKKGTIGKKHEQFITGAEQRGFKKEDAEEIWRRIEACRDYIFNKSHAAVYAYLSYICMWMKVHYPEEFLSACLWFKNEKKFIKEAMRLGVEVILPDINHSEAQTTLKNHKIVIGFSALKGIEKAGSEIIKHQPYTSLQDFADKVNLSIVSKDCIEVLSKVGAFRQFESNNNKAYYSIVQYVEEKKRKILPVQTKKQLDKSSKYFGWVEEPAFFQESVDLTSFEREKKVREKKPFEKVDLETVKDMDDDERRMFQIEYLGYSFVEDKLEAYRDKLNERKVHFIDGFVGKKDRIVGQIMKVDIKKSKKGKTFAFVRIEDSISSLDFLVWEEDLRKYKERIVVGKYVVVKLEKQDGFGNPTLISQGEDKVLLLEKFLM